MNYGGVHGGKLCDLARVVVHMDSPMAFITGITFEYGYNQAVHYGRHAPLEVSFLVDGAKGEQIVRVVVDTGPEGCGDFRIQVNMSKLWQNQRIWLTISMMTAMH